MKSNYLIKSNYLEVSELHKLYFEIWGYPVEQTYLFIHGGPGAGFTENDKRFFNFQKHRVIFYDQRGSSKSQPFGSIVENTTQHLIQDIDKILDHLEIDQVVIFGGSWGSTLGLLYAIHNPARVNGLLLRGLFLANKKATDHYINGGVKFQFPKVWERFIQSVPEENELSISQFYLNKMVNGTSEELEKFAYEWAYYEISIYKSGITHQEIQKVLKVIPYRSLAIMEAHYIANDFFIPNNYIAQNVDKLIEIPTVIVHGINDAICPLKFAIELNDIMPNSKLFATDAGHSDSEEETEKKLLEIIQKNEWV